MSNHLVTEDLPVQPVVRQLSQRSAASTNAGTSVFNGYGLSCHTIYSQSRGDSLEECRAYYPHQDFVHSSCRHRSAITFNRMSVVDKAKQYAVYRCGLQERSAQAVHTALYERSHFVRFRSFHRLQPICDCTRHLHWPEMPKILDLELMEGDVLRLHSQWLARARSKRSKRQKPYGRVAAPSMASRLEN